MNNLSKESEREAIKASTNIYYSKNQQSKVIPGFSLLATYLISTRQGWIVQMSIIGAYKAKSAK
ncbi:MAG: hypothetical protein OEQ53_05870 [Saprospiraceae bacterium]|nr:hypothetical protein [Saprospiraceae bacterium]